jgi:hypothetical protein
MATVEYTRREYDAARSRWRLVRDVCKGSEAIKHCGDEYLPRPNAQDKTEQNLARFDSYLARAVFYNATGRTKNSLVGAVFRTWPTLNVPAALDYVATDIDGQGVSVYQQSQSVIGHLLETGRHGLLVDYPSVEAGTVSMADRAARGIRATVTSYVAESIINWRTRLVGGQHLLSLVVLHETYDTDTDDGFGMETKDQYRVLKLDEAGLYVQELWRNEGGWAPTEVKEPTDGRGTRWSVIPFQFLGSENNDSSIDDSPLYDMAEINIGHYRNSADYEDAAFLLGQPQLVMSGLDEQWYRMLQEDGIYFGSRAPIALPVNASAALLQTSPNTMIKDAMDAKEGQMVALGARLVERGSATKTATQAASDSAAEHSVLSLLVSNVSEGYTQALQWIAQFENAAGEVDYKLAQDFTQITLDANIMAGLLSAVQSGQLPQSEFWQYLRDRGVIDAEKTDDEIRDELQTSDAGLALDE